ncbi:MAG: NIPSNAP family protein [Thermogutta sp.]
MQRREFLASSMIGGAGVVMAISELGHASGEDNVRKQLLELRCYQIATSEKRDRLESFLGAVAIPVWNGMGIKPVGVFRYLEGEDPSLFVLLPHNSCETVIQEMATLLGDPRSQAEGKNVLYDAFEDPTYQRVESSLLLAFDGVPKVEIPTTVETRVFQLRIYESHNLTKHVKKVEMFNTGGELDIFRRCKMNPVFFGQALVGSKLPNLTYMLGFDNIDAQKQAWAAFLKDPQWIELRDKPEYAQTVSNITNILLRPSPVSQI